jgi:3-oxoadipate enol-lactonase
MYAAMVTEMLSQEDRLDALRSLSVPTLVLVGEQDRPLVGASKRMAEAIPGARLAIIPDAGHSPQVEAPEAWAEVVRGFLASLPVTSR